MPLILNGTTGVSGVDGSAGTPSYVGGDSDTGLWYPAANTLALSTSGSERLRIDSSGNVGIGTSSPSYPLQVVKNANGAQRVLFSNNSSGSTAETVVAVSNGTAEGSIRVAGTSYGGYGAYTANNTLIYNDTSAITIMADNATNGIIKFATGSNSERMRIDSSGNLGLGTTATSTYRATIANNGGNQLRLYATDVSTTTTNSIDFWYLDAGGSPYNNTSIRSLSTANAGNGNLVFYTRPTSGSLTEAMRITSGGNLLVGQTALDANAGGALFQLTQNNANWIHYITNTASSGTVWGQYILYTNQAPNNTTSNFFFCADNAALRATFRSNGGLANYSANDVNLSDEREKTNIQLAGSYLDKICAIPVKTFNYIDQNLEEDGGLTLGVIAQDVQKVAPELVMESNWAHKDEPEKMRLSIYQTDLQYALMKCIQEQQAMIEELKQEVALLKSK